MGLPVAHNCREVAVEDGRVSEAGGGMAGRLGGEVREGFRRIGHKAGDRGEDAGDSTAGACAGWRAIELTREA